MTLFERHQNNTANACWFITSPEKNAKTFILLDKIVTVDACTYSLEQITMINVFF